ncbi:MAG: hypothetical protein ACJAU0_001598 [Flavobacteriales bacterium]|jgi:hypothetical protein
MQNKVNKTTNNPKKFNRKLIWTILGLALIVGVAMALYEFTNI